jgi:transcriptional regulator with XRE-family HTH domain
MGTRRREQVTCPHCGATFIVTPHSAGTLFKRRRLALGLTQEDVAKQVGMTRSQYTMIELYQSVGSTFKIMEICRFLGVTAEEWMMDYQRVTSQERVEANDGSTAERSPSAQRHDPRGN